MTPELSVLIATSGRNTLSLAVHSFIDQLGPGDEVLIDVNNDAPYGHIARNRMIPRAKGTHLAFLDDDDIFLPGAFDAIRSTVSENPDRLHIFRMQYRGIVIWQDPNVREGNLSTQQLVIPNIPGKVGEFGSRYEGDFDACVSTLKLLGTEPVFAKPIIARYGN